MARIPELLKLNDGTVEKAIELYTTTSLSITQIAAELKVDYQRLQRLLKKVQKTGSIIPQMSEVSTEVKNGDHKIEIIKSTKLPEALEQNLKLQNMSLRKSIDAYKLLIDKIDELEGYIQQLKDPASGEVNQRYSKEFLIAWQQITNTLSWIVDRKMKVQEIMENQIFRESVLDAIKQQDPKIAGMIKEIIDKKRQEAGLI